jgi:broad specificity phosphatase PhoE
MNRITLIRHGEPEVCQESSLWSVFSGQDLEKFLQLYNICKIMPSDDIPSSLKEIIATGDLFISSGLKRTHESFQLLKVSKFEQNHLFNEADLPCGIGKSIRMPLVIWLITLRLLWRLGLSVNAESYNNFIKRMRTGIEFLDGNKNDIHTVVMAHGFINRHIKKELLRRGWELLSSEGDNSYWSYSTFEKVTS